MLDLKLAETTFLCADNLTIADLVVFNEVTLFIEINEFAQDDPELLNYRNLMLWYKKML